MTISKMRQYLRAMAGNAGDASVFSDTQLDLAIQTALDELVAAIGGIRTIANLTFSAGDTQIIGTADIGVNFREERFRMAYLTGTNVSVDPACLALCRGDWECEPAADADFDRGILLKVWPIERLEKMRVLYPDQTGQPVAIAFSSTGTLEVWPEADDTYALHVDWAAPALNWTPGIAILTAVLTASAVTSVTVVSGGGVYAAAPTLTILVGAATATATLGTTGRVASVAVGVNGSGYTEAPPVYVNGDRASDQTIDLPDDLLRRCLNSGGMAGLLSTSPKHRFGAAKRNEFDKFLAEVALKFQPAPRVHRMRRRW